MDSNKDRALLSKETAEKKFAEKDYAGAKMCAQMAKDLYPRLDFISLFITIIDIYLSREKTVDGQPDWHAVLSLENPATLDKKSENYCKLYWDIKAGGNNVVGAEGALQIISEAFCNLTGAFWTRCPECQFQFQYPNDKINKEIVCFNCCESYLAVPLFSETQPTRPKTKPDMQRERPKVVIGLRAPSAVPVGKKRRSGKGKKEVGKSSVSGDQDDAVA